jgi:hypothetical protein
MRMRLVYLFHTACAVLMLGSFGSANATTLIGQDCGFDLVNAQDCTLDTATGLVWLDLTLSSDISNDEVASELGAGGLFDGWSYATEEQVTTLLLNHGFDTINGTSEGNAAAYPSFAALFGETRPEEFSTDGWTSTVVAFSNPLRSA